MGLKIAENAFKNDLPFLSSAELAIYNAGFERAILMFQPKADGGHAEHRMYHRILYEAGLLTVDQGAGRTVLKGCK